MNGIRTLSENIADNGGLKIVHAAYQTFVQRNGPDELLPEMLDYNQNQLFWISAAQTWCGVEGSDDDDEPDHAPFRFRVQGTFSNMPSFSNDFNCAIGTKMNPVKKCEIKT